MTKPKKRNVPIPGTIRMLNREVQRILMNRELTVTQRAELAAAVITTRVLAAYKIGEQK